MSPHRSVGDDTSVTSVTSSANRHNHFKALLRYHGLTQEDLDRQQPQRPDGEQRRRDPDAPGRPGGGGGGARPERTGVVEEEEPPVLPFGVEGDKEDEEDECDKTLPGGEEEDADDSGVGEPASPPGEEWGEGAAMAQAGSVLESPSAVEGHLERLSLAEVGEAAARAAVPRAYEETVYHHRLKVRRNDTDIEQIRLLINRSSRSTFLPRTQDTLLLAFRRAILGRSGTSGGGGGGGDLSSTSSSFSPSSSNPFSGRLVLDDTRSLGVASHFALRAGARACVVLADTAAEARAVEEAAVDGNGFHPSRLAAAVVGMDAEGESLGAAAAALLRHGGGARPRGRAGPKVDFLLCSWFGECLFSRSRFARFLNLRDRFLDERTGLIFPDEVAIHIW